MTFFSGTDIDTLGEEGKATNHFVSLIVNNAGDRIAKITRHIYEKKVSNCSINYKSFENAEVNKDNIEITTENDYIEYFTLNIEVEDDCNIISQEIKDRYEELKSKKFSTPKNLIFKTTEPTLFSKKDFDDIEDTPKETILTEDFIKDAVRQLITGSITINHNSKFDEKKWIESNMEKVFDKRFKEITDYSNFISAFIEYIIWYSSYDSEDVDTEMSILATNILAVLEEYDSNKYLDEIKSQLNNYII